jgi:hypothetical protein
MIDLKHVIARVIVILIKGAPGDCISITPSLLGNMIGDVRETLRLLRVLYNDPLPALGRRGFHCGGLDCYPLFGG